MSEEKLYAVKNAKGLYLSFSDDKLYRWREGQIAATTSPRIAHDLCTQHGGHVVAFVEEPNPEVVSKAEAKMLDKAKTASYPANYISMNAHPDPGANGTSYEELRLMRALVNGYTVAKEKKYNVKVPHTKDVWYCKINDAEVLTISPVDKTSYGKFTESEIEHFGLQDCERVEIKQEDEK